MSVKQIEILDAINMIPIMKQNKILDAINIATTGKQIELYEYIRNLKFKNIHYGYKFEPFITPIYPSGYCPYNTPGDGLCYIHSLVRSVLMYWYSIGGKDQIESWKTQLYEFMIINKIKIIEYHKPFQSSENIKYIIIFNHEYFNNIIQNILMILFTVWNDININILSDAQQNYGIPPIETTIGFRLLNNNLKITCIDGIARNLIMRLLGVEYLEVIQPYVIHNQIDMKRYNSKEQQVEQILEDGIYRGFKINIDNKTWINNFFGQTLKVCIYSKNSNHYDMLLSIYKLDRQIAVPVCLSNEELPNKRILLRDEII